MHYCAYHKALEPQDEFRTRPNGKLDSWCIEGRKEYNRNYSQNAYAPRKAEIAAQRVQLPTHRFCIDCGHERSINDFPQRSDRPGKYHSRCHYHYRLKTQERNHQYGIDNFETVAAAKRKYHAANPGYNRESSRRRRSRTKVVKHIAYQDRQVRERDQWVCQICHNTIDPALRWPDPWCEVIDHIHPIAKRGPNILKNVRQAHNRCNARRHTEHTNPFVSWTVKPIERNLARALAKAHHYLHRAPNVSFAFGLFSPRDNEPCGIATFGSPSSWRVNRSICPEYPKLVIELNRLWIHDSAPHGAASWFVSRALKQLPSLIVVSYADTGAYDYRDRRPHDGSIYRALSFNYAGRTRARKEWRMPGKTRNVGKVPGAIQSPVTAKERYWTTTGNRRQRRQLHQLVAW